MRSRFEALVKEGLVVSGEYRDVTSVSVRENGNTSEMRVRPLFLPRREVTVLRPARQQ